MKRGSISVEFALTLPFILVMLIGVLEWGRMLAREVAVVTVARDAAHAGALTRSVNDPVMVARLQAQDGLVAAGFDPAKAIITVNLLANPMGNMLKVEVTVPFVAIFRLLPTAPQLYASTTIRREDN